jgi:serine/threonine protein kinase
VFEQKYSRYLSSYVGGYKAPEEVMGGKIDESADMWKVGDVLYSVLTGLQPYYDELHNERSDLIDEKLLAGVSPYIDPRFKDRSFIEGRLVDIMERCFRLQPLDRVNIFEVVRWLRETKQLHEKSE